MLSSNKTDPKPSRFWTLMPLYVRIGFALIILFGMIGNCTGHSGASVVVFMVTAIMWVCVRIVTEAIEAMRILSLTSKGDKPKQ